MAVSFHEHTLGNGLKVVAEVQPEAHTCALGYFVKAGTRDEELGVMGVSHFLEHMMFKGSGRRSADDVNRGFDEIGANYNAYTSHEETVYWAQVLPEYLGAGLDLLSDLLRPALRVEDFDTEKHVILEEIGMYEDRPHWRLNDLLLEKYYGDLSMGYRVLGTVGSIKALRADQMRGYFDVRYGADNIVFAAAGRVDFEKLCEEVERHASSWGVGGAERSYVEHEAEVRDLTVEDERVNRHYIGFMCPGPAVQDDRRYAARILADVLGDTEGSRLYWALVDPGLADEADFSYSPQDRLGSYVGYASCDPGREGKVESILMATVDGALEGVAAEEVERAKNKLATQATLSGENPVGRMRGIGNRWMYLGEYTPLEVELERLMAVTVGDVRSLAEAMPFRPRTVVRLGPKGGG